MTCQAKAQPLALSTFYCSKENTFVSSSSPQLGGKRKLGVLSVAFLVVAASAPLTVVAGGVTTALAVTGSTAIPFGYIVLTVALLVFAVGYAAMSRFVTNAGAFYAYVSQGLSRALGVGSSLIALIAYNMMQIGVAALLGFQVSTELKARWAIDTPWYLWVFVAIVIVGVLGVNRIDFSAKVLGILVALEFLVVIIFDVTGFMAAPDGVPTAPITGTTFWGAATGAILAFGIAAFMGFESGALYGEESKNPKTTIARATYLSVVVIGVFYAISSWAMIAAGGATVNADAVAGPAYFFGLLGAQAGTVIADIASLLFITSLFASLVSFHNAVARYNFSLGREGILPRGLARVTKGGAPWTGSLTQTVIAILVTVGFIVGEIGTAGQYVDPNGLGEGVSLNLFPLLVEFNWLTNSGAMGLVLLMALVSVAVIGYFAKNSNGVNIWSRVIAPVIAAIALFGVFALIVANFNVLLTSDPTAPVTALTFVLPIVVIAPGVIGVIYGLILKRSNPKVYSQIGHGIAEDHTAGGLGESARGV
jgi:amino acid transporter